MSRLNSDSPRTHRSAFHQKTSSPPALYDTSVSSTNEEQSMENSSTPSPQRLLATLGRVRDPEHPTTATQSEPGKASEHDRFVAYVNRFAEFDPRMDYREQKPQEDRSDEGTGGGGSPPNSITSSALKAAMRTHKGRSKNTESRLSKILSKHAGVAAAHRHARSVGAVSRGMETASDTGHSRSHTSHRIREGLVRYANNQNRENQSAPLRVRQPPAISGPRNSLLRAVTDMRAGRPRPQRTAAEPTTTKPRSMSTQRSHHFVSPPTSPETTSAARSRSAPPRRPTPPPTLDAVIQHVDSRAAIEIPSPTKVSDLRQRLWTSNERLRVPEVRPRTPPTVALPFKDRFYEAAERQALFVKPTPVKAPQVVATTAADRQNNIVRLTNMDGQQRSSVTGLIERIEKVNRDDPKVALEEIDEILRSQGSVEDADNDVQVSSGDPSSDGDSTVSSITNPTYQESGARKKKKEAKRHNMSKHRSTPQRTNRSVAPRQLDTIDSAPKGRTFAQVRRDLIKRNDEEDSGILAPEDTVIEEEESGIVSPEISVVIDTPQPKSRQQHDDEISNGVIPSTPQQEREASPGSRQPHPWETAVPLEKVKCAETTMSSGDGIEMNIGSSPERSNAKSSRIQRKWNTEPIEEEVAQPDNEPYEPFVNEDADGAADVEFVGFDDLEAVVFEKHRVPSAHLDQATADAMAKEFDSAWVNLPASKYFGMTDRQSKRTTSRSRRFSNSNLRNQRSFSGDEEDSNPIAYVPVDLDRNDARFGTGRNDGRLTVQSSSSLEPYSGLNTFLDRSVRRDGSYSGDQKTYTSTGSRRFKDLRSKLEHTGQPSKLLPARGAPATQTTDRHRSRSVETKRIRNPKIAKKYSRILRVYGDDDRGASKPASRY